ncbi:hypothetical protein [Gordonia sp. 852002-50816_SCH5313054-a]|uniref:hypothetical protein n=1 Tax=unclassified Gordonia (in: high G+C Gram-positive bacteria) TaxID=2657482 RepID=UPI000B0E5F41
MMDGRRDRRDSAADADKRAHVDNSPPGSGALADGPPAEGASHVDTAGHADGVAASPDLRGRRRSPWNPATWSPATSSFAPNPAFRRPRPRRFASTEHLASEAVAAFVDGELGMTAHVRATHHLALCRECMDAVDAQLDARTRLRDSGTVAMPADLLGQLSQIPTREIDMTGVRDRREQGRSDGPVGPNPSRRDTFHSSPFPDGRFHGPFATPGPLAASGLPPVNTQTDYGHTDFGHEASRPATAPTDAVRGEPDRGRRNRWRGR